MPELPEVETVRRRLEPVLVGRRFDRVEILDPRLTRPEDPLEVAAELVGERVEAVDRRGKYVVVRFESGRALLIHLRGALALLSNGNGQVPWAELAEQCGYYDQSHLINEFRRFTGFSPVELARRDRPDSGSVVLR